MSVFSFPSEVNERAARLVAGVVAVSVVAAIATQSWWVVPLLSLGFWLRVGFGPKVSPLARVAVAVAPRIWPVKPVAGSPKRFAQGIGAVVTAVATVLFLSGVSAAAWALAGVIALFATLEATLAFCAGCWVYGRLQLWGLVSAPVCVDCARVGSLEPTRARP